MLSKTHGAVTRLFSLQQLTGLWTLYFSSVEIFLILFTSAILKQTSLEVHTYRKCHIMILPDYKNEVPCLTEWYIGSIIPSRKHHTSPSHRNHSITIKHITFIMTDSCTHNVTYYCWPRPRGQLGIQWLIKLMFYANYIISSLSKHSL